MQRKGFCLLIGVNYTLKKRVLKERTCGSTTGKLKTCLLYTSKRKNIANAKLVGNVIRIKSILSELGEEDSGFELIPADSDADCAAKAVSAVRSLSLIHICQSAA